MLFNVYEVALEEVESPQGPQRSFSFRAGWGF